MFYSHTSCAHCAQGQRNERPYWNNRKFGFEAIPLASLSHNLTVNHEHGLTRLLCEGQTDRYRFIMFEHADTWAQLPGHLTIWPPTWFGNIRMTALAPIIMLMYATTLSFIERYVRAILLSHFGEMTSRGRACHPISRAFMRRYIALIRGVNIGRTPASTRYDQNCARNVLLGNLYVTRHSHSRMLVSVWYRYKGNTTSLVVFKQPDLG